MTDPMDDLRCDGSVRQRLLLRASPRQGQQPPSDSRGHLLPLNPYEDLDRQTGVLQRAEDVGEDALKDRRQLPTLLFGQADFPFCYPGVDA